MTEYETMMLKLKLLELAQRQVLLEATCSPDQTVLVDKLAELLENITAQAEKLL